MLIRVDLLFFLACLFSAQYFEAFFRIPLDHVLAVFQCYHSEFGGETLYNVRDGHFFHQALILCDFSLEIDGFGGDSLLIVRFLLFFLASGVLFWTLRFFLSHYSVFVLAFYLFVLILNFVLLFVFGLRSFYLSYCGSFILPCFTSFDRLLQLVLFDVLYAMVFFDVVLRCVVSERLLLLVSLLEFLYRNGHI